MKDQRNRMRDSNGVNPTARLAILPEVFTVDTAPLPTRPPHKTAVAILGFTDHRQFAFELPDRDRWELWGLNELHRYHDWKLFDRWFEIHDRAILEPDKAHLQQMAKFEIPVYMHRHWDDIPLSQPFPKGAVERWHGERYFTSSIAWELGLALAMGFEEIHVYGVDMANDREYFKERNCCEYWLGRGRGMGRIMYVPDVSDLLKCVGQYGFGDIGDTFTKKLQERKAWLHTEDNDRLALLRKLEKEFEQKHGGLLARRNELVGAINELKLQVQHDFLTAEARKVVEERIAALHGVDNECLSKIRAIELEMDQKYTALLAERNQILGGIQNCEFFERSWSLPSHSHVKGPTPDRSLDAKTGITADQAKVPEPEPDPAGV